MSRQQQRQTAWALLVLIAVAGVAAMLPMVDIFGLMPTEENQDPPAGGGGGGSCTYCSSTACGCNSPPVGCTLGFSCGCSSVDCWRTCSYNC